VVGDEHPRDGAHLGVVRPCQREPATNNLGQIALVSADQEPTILPAQAVVVRVVSRRHGGGGRRHSLRRARRLDGCGHRERHRARDNGHGEACVKPHFSS
jgi:hypothetical protein